MFEHIRQWNRERKLHHKDRVAEKKIQRVKARIQQRREKGEGKLRICFIVQETTTWEKSKDVYEKLLADDHVTADIFLIPNYQVDDIGKRKIGEYGEEYDFYHDRYENVIDAIDVHGTWLNLQELHYDYIFYSRPYDLLLPEQYRSDVMIETSLLGYISYAAGASKNFYRDWVYNPFYRHIYLFFCSVAYEKELLEHRFQQSEYVRHIFFKGYPEWKRYLELPHVSPINDTLTILWTPRWTIDAKLGGSHFLEYSEKFLDLRKKYPRANLIIRPHPLMFQHFVSEGIITKEWELDYRRRLEDSHIELDEGASLYDTFKRTDILITDISSIIFAFFITGKPVIYCPFDVEYIPEFDEILKTLYIADGWLDVLKTLDDIYRSDDIMKDKRMLLISTNYEYHIDAAEDIYREIIENI